MHLNTAQDRVEMTQPYLIEKIIELLGDSIKDTNVKSTPALYKEILYKEIARRDSTNYNYFKKLGIFNTY